MPPTAWDFQNHLMAMLNAAQQSGEPHLDVDSSNLHLQVGARPGSTSRMSVCREVMIKMMRAGDSIIKESPGGTDEQLIVRYVFGRTGRA
jgi:hypothetical protein